MPESAAIVRRFDDPDERRTFPLGRLDLVQIGAMSVGRAEYEQLISGNPLETPLDPEPMVQAFRRWDEEIGVTKRK